MTDKKRMFKTNILFIETKNKETPVEFKIRKINRDIFAVINGDGGWCRSNMVYHNGLLVDAGPDPVICGDNITALKKELDKYDLEVDTIVITHPDIDHVGGLKLFPGARIVAAGKSVRPLSELKPSMMDLLVKLSFLFADSGKQFKENMKMFDLKGIVVRKPDETFEDSLNMDRASLKSFEYCHSHNDTIVVLPDNVIASGDLLFHGVTPVVWGDPVNWIKAIDHILNLNPEVIIPGHGDIMNSGDILTMKNYLEFIVDRAGVYHGKNYPLTKAVEAVAKELPAVFKNLLLPERLAVNIESCYAMIGKTGYCADYPVMKKFNLFGKMRRARRYFEN
jgi:cyclase